MSDEGVVYVRNEPLQSLKTLREAGVDYLQIDYLETRTYKGILLYTFFQVFEPVGMIYMV